MKKAMMMAAILLAATLTGCSTAASALTAPAQETVSCITAADTEEETNAYGKHPGECGYSYCD